VLASSADRLFLDEHGPTSLLNEDGCSIDRLIGRSFDDPDREQLNPADRSMSSAQTDPEAFVRERFLPPGITPSLFFRG